MAFGTPTTRSNFDGKRTPLEVFDKEQVGNDKFMGHARVSIVDWIAAGTFTGDVDVTDMSDRPVGKVNLKATFFRPGEGGDGPGGAGRDEGIDGFSSDEQRPVLPKGRRSGPSGPGARPERQVHR